MTNNEEPGRRYRPNPAKTMLPRMRCPVCNAQAFTRTSEEISPESRRLYYACSEITCGLTFAASLTVEKVISPSAISATFRPAVQRERQPPGHEYGQTFQRGLFDPPEDPPPSAA